MSGPLSLVIYMHISISLVILIPQRHNRIYGLCFFPSPCSDLSTDSSILVLHHQICCRPWCGIYKHFLEESLMNIYMSVNFVVSQTTPCSLLPHLLSFFITCRQPTSCLHCIRYVYHVHTSCTHHLGRDHKAR